ncbi:cardiolipin synthase [Pseudalkalibacillus caeni]|uniref:Cardiolipin synthase n=1 Tax=Exobacillus caeni TaxID=2574798 RepID=A0A5R9F467_9BACL|nr:cardiolipin synthase [Pseudalkalibacillus caeni]TLS37801.1 cardiolipin synthase [Pseudalkalibacillus caeni]
MFKRIQIIVFVLFVALALYFTEQYWENWLLGVISILFSLSAFFIGIVIFLENRHPSKTITWLIVLAVFPVVGFVFYIVFGQDYRKKKLFQKKAELDEQAFMRIEGNRTLNENELEKMGDHQKLLFRLAHNLGKSPISFATATEVLTNGKETFDEILKALEQATHHIHLEYYIVRSDEIGEQIKEVLIRKAKEGVEVRFLYDSVGSWKLSKTYISELLAAGVQMISFSPVRLPFLNNKINFRNHRKIIVIDGTIGFSGGLNIGDEYLGRNKYFGLWRDTHLLLKGEAVRSLQLIFLRDWYYMTDQALLDQDYLSPDLEVLSDTGGVQMIAGGPDQHWETIKNLFFSMIVSAKKSIYITSPYFIPDEDILSALKVAALSGIDVRIIVPDRPDKRIVFYASRSYFPELLDAGVKVYEYKEGFLHSKVIIVDNELASIGTSNMDMRSFHLNFEVNTFLFKTNSTTKLVKDFLNDLDHSKPIEFVHFNKRPILARVVESTSRLLSPLL